MPPSRIQLWAALHPSRPHAERMVKTQTKFMLARDVLESALLDPSVRTTVWMQSQFIDPQSGQPMIELATDDLLDTLEGEIRQGMGGGDDEYWQAVLARLRVARARAYLGEFAHRTRFGSAAAANDPPEQQGGDAGVGVDVFGDAAGEELRADDEQDAVVERAASPPPLDVSEARVSTLTIVDEDDMLRELEARRAAATSATEMRRQQALLASGGGALATQLGYVRSTIYMFCFNGVPRASHCPGWLAA